MELITGYENILFELVFIGWEKIVLFSFSWNSFMIKFKKHICN